MAVAGAGLVGTLSLVAGQVIKMRDRFTALDQATGTRSLNNFGKAAVGVGAALGVASVALAVYTVHQQKAAQNNQEMIEGFQELSRVADAQVLDPFTEALANGYLAGKDLDEILRELATTNIEGARRLLDVGEKSGWTAEQIAALEKAIAQA